MNKTNRKPRQYNKITPVTVAHYKLAKLEEGNGTSAVRLMTPTILDPATRAWSIQRKAEEVSTIDFIDEQLQRIGVDAINRIGLLVNSPNEGIATKNTHYVTDHLRGQAVRRSESKHLNLNIESVL